MIVASLLLLAAVTGGIVLDGAGPDSALRHLYLLPVLGVARVRGVQAGALIGLVAGLLQAPFVLPAIERGGLVPATVDGLIALAAPLVLGWMVGRLVDEWRIRADGLDTLLDLERALSGPGALAERLAVAVDRLRSALHLERAALLLGDGDGSVIAVGAPPAPSPDPAGAAVWAMRHRREVVVGDVAVDGRFDRPARLAASTPMRGLVVPLASSGRVIGALAMEWAGERSRRARRMAQELALHLPLAIENARLGLVQRRFAHELEEKVTAATGRLRELDRARAEFLSMVSHELRTPLTALQGFGELLLEREVPPARARRCLEHIATEARRLGRIVGELLDLSRIEAGQAIALTREPVDLRDIVERNVELCAGAHGRHRIVAEPPAAGWPALRGDADALDRMLKNLLSNAVKYSPAGGEVRVRVVVSPGEPGMVEISVADQGVGIPPDALSRIFDKYVRLPHPDTRSVSGLGLGLAMVRALAELSGGRVEVWSAPGSGSRFTLVLPR